MYETMARFWGVLGFLFTSMWEQDWLTSVAFDEGGPW